MASKHTPNISIIAYDTGMCSVCFSLVCRLAGDVCEICTEDLL